jgi:hypothetical protein
MTLRELQRRFPLGTRRPVLVTEVTRMTSGICVAAYDLHGHRVVRPLPRDIDNWQSVEFTSGRITVGSVLGIRPPTSAYPHAREDLRLAESPVQVDVLTRGEVLRALHSTADESVSAIFDGNLLDRKYVQERNACRSLGAIMTPAARIRPYVDGYDKLRVAVTDQGDTTYHLPITDMEARQVQAAQDAEAAAQYVQDQLNRHSHATQIMVRLGLARGFGRQDHGHRLWRSPHSWFGAVATIVKLRTISLAGDFHVSQSPARAIRDRSARAIA